MLAALHKASPVIEDSETVGYGFDGNAKKIMHARVKLVRKQEGNE